MNFTLYKCWQRIADYGAFQFLYGFLAIENGKTNITGF